MFAEETLNKWEKQKAKELLDELTELGPEELPGWNIKAKTLLVFIAMRNPGLCLEQLYKFCWGNNLKRQTMKGRTCRVICRAKKMNSCMIEFTDNGQRECVSRYAVRKIKNG